MWISQLRDATEHNLGDVGRNAEDVEALQQEHEKLEATARVRRISVLILILTSFNILFSRLSTLWKFSRSGEGRLNGLVFLHFEFFSRDRVV